MPVAQVFSLHACLKAPKFCRGKPSQIFHLFSLKQSKTTAQVIYSGYIFHVYLSNLDEFWEESQVIWLQFWHIPKVCENTESHHGKRWKGPQWVGDVGSPGPTSLLKQGHPRLHPDSSWISEDFTTSLDDLF